MIDATHWRRAVWRSALFRASSLAVLCAACLAWAEQDPRAEVQRLTNIGQYADAERIARAGGPATAVLLGDVLVMRGRLKDAAGAYDQAVSAAAPDRLAAEVALAELAARRGDRAGAEQRATSVVRAHGNIARPTGSDHVAAGRALVLLMTGSTQVAQRALGAFDAAIAMDSSNLDAQRHEAALWLAKNEPGSAKRSYLGVLRRAPNDARALLGLARAEEEMGMLGIADEEGAPPPAPPLETARRALRINASFSDAMSFVSRMHLNAEAYDSSRIWAQRAIAADSSSESGWAQLGATAWLTGDSATYTLARSAVAALQPKPSNFYTDLAEAAIRQRRYADANQFAQQAVANDSLSIRALSVLGTNQLRLGQMTEGRQSLDRAWALDKSNRVTLNMLTLVDEMLKTFRTIDSKHFSVVAPPEEAELLSLYILPLLEQAFDSLSVRYGYSPPTPVRLEFFNRSADFSVRALGVYGLGALGVSFGSVLAMDAPRAREQGTWNWGSTAWHELTHAFTLGASGHRVPRWLSEGLSVLEERRTQRGWGAGPTLSFVSAFGAGRLHPMSRLPEGFSRPRFPEEIQFSYYQASLFCEWVEQSKGAKALPAMLFAYRDGANTATVFQRVLGLTPAQVDTQFDAWMRQRFATPLRFVVSKDTTRAGGGGQMGETMRSALSLIKAGKKDSARVLLEQAQRMFPEYAGSDGPSWFLAELARDRGDTVTALREVANVTTRNESAWEANLMEADLREKRRDLPGTLAALDRLFWIYPYDPELHVRAATIAGALGDHPRAVRERRAVIALMPTDLLDARYELARALAASGDVAGARRELLQVLEQAPSFEKAQALLLELRAKSTSGGVR